MMTELKPCPFCGGKVEYTEDNGEYENHITCHACDFRMSGKWLKDPTTILKWNTRAVPDVPELVRYEFSEVVGEHVERDDGEYVRYGQAAEMLAALKAELYDMRQERDRALGWRDHDKERAEAAEAKLEELERHVGHLEQMRPFWAQGFSSDSMAAQVQSAALAALHAMLEARNQSDAVSKLKALKADLSFVSSTITDIANELGCKPYNEEILQTIFDMKSKLAEYEKQEPIGVIHQGIFYSAKDIEEYPEYSNGIKLYASPAPMEDNQ